MATSLLSSAKSRLTESSRSFSLTSNWLVLKVGNPVSRGMTTSEPYVIENEVSPVDLLGVV